MALSANLGFPRIGANRELKKATEAFWKGTLSERQLLEAAAKLRREHWQLQREAGIDSIPSNDFSLYDQVLDTVALVGAVPPRYHHTSGPVSLETYFAMARGIQRSGLDVPAMDMTKWFDTNYHYIVPEYSSGQRFARSSDKPLAEWREAKAAGITTRPVLLGPLSLLLLGKSKDGTSPLKTHLDQVLEVYAGVIKDLAAAGAEWIQIDEPCWVIDRSAEETKALERAYRKLADAKGKAKLLVQTYFGHVGDAYSALTGLPVEGVGLDLVRGRENLALIERHGFPKDKWLAAGVVDGRNIWISDLSASLSVLQGVAKRVNPGRLIVQPSCSLLHVPIDVSTEQKLDAELKSWLAFARQKLDEVVVLTRALNQGVDAAREAFEANARALVARRSSPRTRNPKVRDRLASFAENGGGYGRRPFAERHAPQAKHLGVAQRFPTTTIGSFPQTPEVRKARRRFKDGEIDRKVYEGFIEEETRKVIRLQEEIGLDVLVHGEFERNDMVEYFGEQLEGYAFTEHGWVQSYGSRYVKPPVLFGDVHRPKAMTVRWSTFAQSCTKKPVKGMLTGPVTILQWSFVRDDQPRSDTCRQLAVAIRDEVLDLERAELKVIQVDEPAIREGLPLRRGEWKDYLEWAVECFRLAIGGVKDQTQVQTHMCYSEFGDIMDAVSAMDADVLLIENARSDAELLQIFKRVRYDKDVGPGVYDIHSPRVPSADEVLGRLKATLEVLPQERVWVNPDCGLKTRTYEECVPALKNMVAAARTLRES